MKLIRGGITRKATSVTALAARVARMPNEHPLVLDAEPTDDLAARRRELAAIVAICAAQALGARAMGAESGAVQVGQPPKLVIDPQW